MLMAVEVLSVDKKNCSLSPVMVASQNDWKILWLGRSNVVSSLRNPKEQRFFPNYVMNSTTQENL